MFPYFQEFVTKDLPNGSTLYKWERLNEEFLPETGSSKTRIWNESAKRKLFYVTRDTEDWITELELFIGDFRKLGVIIDDVEMMTHIMYNLPK